MGAKYRIKHLSMGSFVGECVASYAGWATFRVLDGNAELADIDVSAGDEVELTTDFYRAVEIKPEWKHQPALSPKT